MLLWRKTPTNNFGWLTTTGSVLPLDGRWQLIVYRPPSCQPPLLCYPSHYTAPAQLVTEQLGMWMCHIAMPYITSILILRFWLHSIAVTYVYIIHSMATALHMLYCRVISAVCAWVPAVLYLCPTLDRWYISLLYQTLQDPDSPHDTTCSCRNSASDILWYMSHGVINELHVLFCCVISDTLVWFPFIKIKHNYGIRLLCGSFAETVYYIFGFNFLLCIVNDFALFIFLLMLIFLCGGGRGGAEVVCQ